jgi:hypothetical protein
MEVWLVVIMVIAGDPPRYMLNERRAGVPACMQEAADVLSTAADHDGEFEMIVQCSVVKKKGDPA